MAFSGEFSLPEIKEEPFLSSESFFINNGKTPLSEIKIPEENIFENKEFKYSSYPDFTFIINKSKFHVDKTLTSSYSKVIKAMFNDKDSKELELKDVKPNTFEIFCEFAHTPPFSFYDIKRKLKNGTELIELTDFSFKYDVQFLLDDCESSIILYSTITLEQKLKLSSEYRLYRLSKHVSKLLCSKSEIKEDDIKMLLKCKPQVLVDIFKTVFDKKNQYKNLLQTLSTDTLYISPQVIKTKFTEIDNTFYRKRKRT
jgi:hypothetical protein